MASEVRYQHYCVDCSHLRTGIRAGVIPSLMTFLVKKWRSRSTLEAYGTRKELARLRLFEIRATAGRV